MKRAVGVGRPGAFRTLPGRVLAFVAALLALATAAAGGPVAASASGAKLVRSLAEIRGQDVVRQEWDLSCGAAVVATIFTYQLGRPTTERDVAVAMLKRTSPTLVRSRLGFSLLDLKIFAATHGVSAAAFADMDLGDLDRLAPVITPISLRGFRHFVIYRGRAGGRVLLADPAFGNRTMPEEVFRKAWANGIGFVIFDPARPQAPNRMGAPADLFLMPNAQTERAAIAGG